MSESQSIVVVTADDLSTDGRGVIHSGGMAYFVPSVFPGDTVEVALDPASKPPSGRLIKLIQTSPKRVQHPCPEAASCQGSVWGSLDYSEQLVYKHSLIVRTLRKAIGEADVLPFVASPRPWHYRNRISLSVWEQDGTLRLGYKNEARHKEGIAIQTCLLAHESLLPCLTAMGSAFADIRTVEASAVPSRIQIHRTRSGAGVMLTFAGRIAQNTGSEWQKRLRKVAIPGGLWIAEGSRAGIIQSRQRVLPIGEAEPMMTSWMGHEVDVNPATFCQTNTDAANLFLERLKEYGASNSFSRIWDLYGGFGALGFAAAGKQPLSVLELTAVSDETMRKLAAKIGHSHAEFISGDLVRTLKQAAARIGRDDLLILDPPRSGAHPEIVDMIGKSAARHVIYMSCNPARLGRDLVHFKSSGFRITELQPYDFFPQTPRIEVCCILER
jgi:23S rRNA (uracil1939-C5)-methyltransferase